jgi:hypothetical protein
MIVWARGGTAELLTMEHESVTLRSTIPSPPGSRIDGTFEGTVVRFKIHGSKKQDDGSFVLQGRALDLTREVRERLAASAVGRAADV